MKRLFFLLFLVLFNIQSTYCFAGWTKTHLLGAEGETVYVNFADIKVHDGYVYFWRLSDYLRPDKYGDMSSQVYYQADCNLNRVKTLSYIFSKMNMGKGPLDQQASQIKEWKYPHTNSIALGVLKLVCTHVENK